MHICTDSRDPACYCFIIHDNSDGRFWNFYSIR